MLSGNYGVGTKCHCGRSSCNVCGSNRRWSALDPADDFSFSRNRGTITQEADQVSDMQQRSIEHIIIRDSAEVTVTTTDTQVALSLQAALQVAIAIVVNIAIASNDDAEALTQELLQFSQIQQVNRQTICIENCRGVTVTTLDTDVAVSIQLLLQILLALLIQLEVL